MFLFFSLVKKFCSIIFLLFGCLVFAQETGFLIRNYSPKEYNGFNQVWCATQDSSGVLYFGTSTNIITYNGRKWDRIFVKQGVPIRALVIKDGRIYVGAEGEFGYVDRKPNGSPYYVSLISRLPKNETGFTDIWKVLIWKDKLVFHSYEKIFIYDGRDFQIVNPQTSFALSFVTDGRFFVRQREVGMMEITDKYELKLVNGGSFFKQLPVIAFEKDEINNAFIVCGSQDGILVYDEASGTTLPVDASINEKIISAYPITLSRHGPDTWLLTGRSGFFVLNSDFSVRHVFNKENGIYDDVVTGTFFSNDGNLWLTLNNGISMIEWDADGIYLTEKSGYKGSVEDLVLHNGTYYIATTNSIYSMPYSSVSAGKPEFTPMNCEITEYWDMQRAGNKIFAAATAGLYEIHSGKITKFSKHWGRYFLIFSDTLPVLVSLEKNFISVFDIKENATLIRELSFPGEEFLHGLAEVKDNEYHIWASTLSGKLYRFVFDKDFQLIKQRIYTKRNGLQAPFQNIYSVDGKIILPVSNKLNTYFPERDIDSNSVCFELAFPIDQEKDLTLANNFNGKFYVGITYSAYARKIENGKYRLTLFSLRQAPSEFTTYITDDSLRTWFLNPEFTVLIKKFRQKPRKLEIPVMLTWFQAGNDSNQVFYGRPANTTFEYRNNSFSFEYALPYFTEPNQTLYRCRLIGGPDTSWTTWSLANRKEYTNLHEGDYEFCIQAKTIFGDVSNESKIVFTVLPPWYRTGWSYLLYAILFIGLTVGIVRLSNFRLKQSKIKLEKLVSERTHELQEKKKEITDSIKYALRIQTAILPPQEFFKRLLPDSFTFYRPKDIVSGDFYWVEEIRGKSLFAAVDCTGHGVPGAMMSVIGLRLLNSAVNDRRLDTPSDILNFLDKGIHETLRQGDAGSGVKDGMDLALCTWDKTAGVLEYAGVCNSLWLVRKNISKTWKLKNSREVFFNDDLLEIKPDKMSIGNNADRNGDAYTNHYIKLQPGDCIYIYSDGYADQFGGPNNKKFKYNRLKELLLAVSHLPMAEQEKILSEQFDSWKGSNDQIDDVLVMGVRV